MPHFVNTRPVNVPIGGHQLRAFFKEHDKNGDGCLDKEELKKAFQKLGAYFPSWRATRALQHADANGDGFISTEEEMEALVRYTMQLGYQIY